MNDDLIAGLVILFVLTPLAVWLWTRHVKTSDREFHELCRRIERRRERNSSAFWRLTA